MYYREEIRQHSLHEEGGVGDVVDHTVNLFVGSGINVRQQPVVEDISLDPPGESQSSVRLDEVDQAGFGVLLGTGSSLEGVGLGSLGSLGGCLSSDGELQHLGSSRECLGRLGESALVQGALRRDGTREKGVTVRENASVGGNLTRISTDCQSHFV